MAATEELSARDAAPGWTKGTVATRTAPTAASHLRRFIQSSSAIRDHFCRPDTSVGETGDMSQASGQSRHEYVQRTVEERGIRYIQLWFTDVLGTPKSFSITPAELENALEEGMTFDGSAIDGFSRVQESAVLARPDANT